MLCIIIILEAIISSLFFMYDNIFIFCYTGKRSSPHLNTRWFHLHVSAFDHFFDAVGWAAGRASGL